MLLKSTPFIFFVFISLYLSHLLYSEEAIEQEFYILPDFVVSDDQDKGYYSANTLAGTRTNELTKNIPMTISTVNEEMIKDFGMKTLADLGNFVPSIEAEGNVYNNSEIRFRGFLTRNQLYEFMPRYSPLDWYNVGRSDIIRGANSLIYGQADPGGKVNVISKTAQLSKNKGSIQIELGDKNWNKFTFDYNRIVGDNTAARFMFVDKYREFDLNHKFQGFTGSTLEIMHNLSPTSRLRFHIEEGTAKRSLTGGTFKVASGPTGLPNGIVADPKIAQLMDTDFFNYVSNYSKINKFQSGDPLAIYPDVTNKFNTTYDYAMTGAFGFLDLDNNGIPSNNYADSNGDGKYSPNVEYGLGTTLKADQNTDGPEAFVDVNRDGTFNDADEAYTGGTLVRADNPRIWEGSPGGTLVPDFISSREDIKDLFKDIDYSNSGTGFGPNSYNDRNFEFFLVDYENALTDDLNFKISVSYEDVISKQLSSGWSANQIRHSSGYGKTVRFPTLRSINDYNDDPRKMMGDQSPYESVLVDLTNANGAWAILNVIDSNSSEPFSDILGNGYWEEGEVYTDTNANGRWDSGEDFIDSGNGIFDSSEILSDLNNNGTWDEGELFIDELNGKYDLGETFTDTLNGVYDLDSDIFIDTPNQQFDIGEVFVDTLNNRYDLGELFSDLPNGEYDEFIDAYEDLNYNAVRDDAESFTDLNGNGQWDVGEDFLDTNTNGQWDDAEPYYDYGNGQWDEGEIFVDSGNNNGVLDVGESFTDVGDGQWNPGETYVDSNFNFQYDGPEEYTDDNGNGQWDPGEALADLNWNNVWDDAEEFTDIGNGIWDEGEEYTDDNGNGQWDPQEGFIDAGNDNGQWDQGEGFVDYGNGRWDDAETFTDDNGNGTWDSGESYVDTNSNGQWDSAESFVDGFNGIWDQGNGIWDDAETFTDDNANGQWDAGEAFTDDNGNGIWDDAENYVDTNNNGNWDIGEMFTDQGEFHYVDTNNNGQYDPGEESGDLNGMYDAPELWLDRNGDGTWTSGETFTDVDGDGFRDYSIQDVRSLLIRDIVAWQGGLNSAAPFRDEIGNGQWDAAEAFIDIGNGEWDAGENYTDTNANGQWDEGEAFVDLGNGQYDEGEAFTDIDGNGEWDDAEAFTDLDGNGQWNEGEQWNDSDGIPDYIDFNQGMGIDYSLVFDKSQIIDDVNEHKKHMAEFFVNNFLEPSINDPSLTELEKLYELGKFYARVKDFLENSHLNYEQNLGYLLTSDQGGTSLFDILNNILTNGQVDSVRGTAQLNMLRLDRYVNVDRYRKQLIDYSEADSNFSDRESRLTNDPYEAFKWEDSGYEKYVQAEPFIDIDGDGLRGVLEVYTDTNANGQWDEGEAFVDVGNGQWDEGETFTDINNNGEWDQGEGYTDVGNGQWNEAEEFTDLNGDGQWTGDGEYVNEFFSINLEDFLLTEDGEKLIYDAIPDWTLEGLGTDRITLALPGVDLGQLTNRGTMQPLDGIVVGDSIPDEVRLQKRAIAKQIYQILISEASADQNNDEEANNEFWDNTTKVYDLFKYDLDSSSDLSWMWRDYIQPNLLRMIDAIVEDDSYLDSNSELFEEYPLPSMMSSAVEFLEPFIKRQWQKATNQDKNLSTRLTISYDEKLDFIPGNQQILFGVDLDRREASRSQVELVSENARAWGPDLNLYLRRDQVQDPVSLYDILYNNEGSNAYVNTTTEGHQYTGAPNWITNYNIPLGELNRGEWKELYKAEAKVDSTGLWMAASGSYFDGRLRTLIGARRDLIETDSTYSNFKLRNVDNSQFVLGDEDSENQRLSGGTSTADLDIKSQTTTNPVWTPSIGGLFWMTDSIAIFGNYSKSVISPTGFQFDVFGDITPPETGEGTEIGFKLSTPDNVFNGQLTAFTIDKKNEQRQNISWPMLQAIYPGKNPNGTARTEPYSNGRLPSEIYDYYYYVDRWGQQIVDQDTGLPRLRADFNPKGYRVADEEVRSRGIELDMYINPTDNISIFLGYAYLKTNILKSALDVLEGMPTAGTSDHNVNMTFRYKFNQGKLKGTTLGMNQKYRSAALLSHYFEDLDFDGQADYIPVVVDDYSTGGSAQITKNPRYHTFWLEDQFNTDLFIKWSGKINKGIPWTVLQFNVNNIFDEKTLISTGLNNARYTEGRHIVFSAGFYF